MKRALLISLLAAAAATGPAACGDDESGGGGKGGTGGAVDACGFGGGGGADLFTCEDGLVCIDNVCTNCTTDEQCGRIQLTCDTALTGTCRFRSGWGDECQTHDGCVAGTLCVQGLCTPTRPDLFCGGLGQCLEGQRCNLPLDVCEEDLGCRTNVDCFDTEVCNTATQECEVRCTVETEAEVCQNLQHCTADGRCVECETDDECGVDSGLKCNVAAGQCVAEGFCFVDRECPSGQLCHFATRTCVSELPPCLSDNECPLGRRCDLDSGACIDAVCVIDQQEPNDTKQTSSVLQAEMRNLTLCPGNEDWYTTKLAAGDQVSITIEADVLAADRGVDATLEDRLGRVLDRSPFTVTATVQEADEYFLRVRPLAGQRLDYGLSFVRAAGTPCVDDRYEDNETAGTARTLIPGLPTNLRLCAADPDFFVVAVPTGKTARVKISHDPSKGLMELLLLDSDGRTLLGADPGKATQEVSGKPSAGRAYIQVTSSDGAIQSAYELEVTVQ